MDNPDSSRSGTFLAAWRDSLADLLTQLGPAVWRPASAATIPPEPSSAAISLQVALTGGLPGVLRICLSTADAGRLLTAFRDEAAGIEGKPDVTRQEALVELCRQWAGLAMARLNPDFGEVAAEVSWSDGPPREGLPAHRLELASDSQQVAATLELETALALLLDSRPLGPPAEVLAPPRKTAGDESLREGNLDLLLDVELGVTLRFGSRRAPLREVLELSPGAVLELNREIQEPVDLLLNERVIARGEVVVVDGNYGLSVTEVLAPEPHRKGVL